MSHAGIIDEEGVLDVDLLLETAKREREIVRLLGPSDEYEAAWMHYLDQLVAETEAYVRRVSPPERSAAV